MEEQNTPPAKRPVADARARAKEEKSLEQLMVAELADDTLPLVREHLAGLSHSHHRALLARFHAQGIHHNARMSAEVFAKAVAATLQERL